MSENNLIECQYGHHMCKREEFTQSGLDNKYTICRKCNATKSKKYRQLHRDKYNNSRRDCSRIWQQNKRLELLINENSN